MMKKPSSAQYGYAKKQTMYTDHEDNDKKNIGPKKTTSLIGVGDTDNPSTVKKCGIAVCSKGVCSTK